MCITLSWLKFCLFLRHRYLGEDFQFSGKISLGQIDTVSMSLLSTLCSNMYQSWVPIKQLSLFCCVFVCIIIVFKALHNRTLVKDGAHSHCIDTWIADAYLQCVWVPLSGRSVLQNKLHKRIMLHYHLWLSNILYICGSPGWKSNIIPSHILSASPSLTLCSAELLLRAGLTCKHMNIWCVCEAHMSPALSRSLAL